MARTPRRADVVVIGAGIVGLASAYELAARKLNVCVLDGAEPGVGQSSRNWGFVRQQGRAVEELPLMIEANKMWPALSGRLGTDIEWVQGGNLRLTDHPERADDYRRWIETAGSLGLDSRVVTAAEVREIVPGFTGQFALGIFTPSDGQANPSKVVTGYLTALVSEGGEVYSGCSAREIVTAGGRVAGVRIDDGFIASSSVVVAAGVGSGALLRRLGYQAPVHFVSQTVALTEKVPRLTDACVWTGQVGFRQTASGHVVVSSGGQGAVVLDTASLGSLLSPRQLRQAVPMYWQNREYLRIHPRTVLSTIRSGRRGGYLSGEVRYEEVERSLATMTAYFPGRQWNTVTAWAGTIDGTPDALPIVDVVGPRQDVIVATGMSGHGFGIAPAIGRVVADLVMTGTSRHDLQPFRLSRFVDGVANPPRHLL
ncbi:MAG: NAD(P)/FAD-dependent oxidoreductase [Acidimicrobiales bacterium]